MENHDERAKLFLPFAALGGLEEWLALQTEAQAQSAQEEKISSFSKKVQKNNADTC